jgi:hypothetical protein
MHFLESQNDGHWGTEAVCINSLPVGFPWPLIIVRRCILCLTSVRNAFQIAAWEFSLTVKSPHCRGGLCCPQNCLPPDEFLGLIPCGCQTNPKVYKKQYQHIWLQIMYYNFFFSWLIWLLVFKCKLINFKRFDLALYCVSMTRAQTSVVVWAVKAAWAATDPPWRG